MNNKAKGNIGENLAADYLVKNGYKILARNAVFYGCELDIVALYSARLQKKQLLKDKSLKLNKDALKLTIKNLEDLIVFVEVKYSSSRAAGEPYERVNARKQNQIHKASEGFMVKSGLSNPIRYDVISIVGDQVEHIIDAF